MALIQVENLSFSYPGSYELIFEQVHFHIDTNWKLGFVGRNGRGKTTFLRLLQGKYEYQGKITSSVSFEYFPYPVENKERWTLEILQEICPSAEDWRFMRELSLLQVDEGVLWRPFATLSPGEQTKALLAALFLKEGSFLLIDEPTNHLDMQARALLAEYLRRKKGFILVSHDRAFLDGCVDHILALNRNTIEVQSGNFSSWMENFNRQQQFEKTRNERLKQDIARLEQAAKHTANWSDRVESTRRGVTNSGSKIDRGYVGHRSAKMMQRSKSLQARQQAAIEEKSGLLKNMERADDLKLAPLKHHARKLVTLSDVSLHYDRPVCSSVHLTVERGERVALSGGNGSGKSSLLKLILKEKIPHTGTVQTASGLIISYVPQDTSFLRGSLTEFIKRNSLDETLFKTILRKMDFDRSQFEKNLEDFSGGQKKKVLIAKSLCEKAHLYIWDEPLNFIDVYSRMQIEKLLLSFSPTMIFVEHDRAFVEAAATRILSL